MAIKEIVINLNEGAGQTKTLGFVMGREGATGREIREGIDSSGLASNDYRFMGGSRMLPISEKQEEIWKVTNDGVTIEYKIGDASPAKRPRVDSSGASNEVDGDPQRVRQQQVRHLPLVPHSMLLWKREKEKFI
ncbi:hypothetical protein GOP47_0019475 [Adiantum capillus-veneris]|uniref:Uncharacterized protein n=1 Tax=Adiantum capillus-veneris TaxID=13818 RepID=A0A9D4Z8I1_ADICA|nr:hypothetical protein GOP47_0019475 [Adiantum capillus-veneris]